MSPDVGLLGGTNPSRPVIGQTLISCPMVCLLESVCHGDKEVVPLPSSLLQYDVRCHISQAFIELLLVCQYPPSCPERDCAFFLPKSADTTITEITVKNLEKSNMRATMVVHVDDYKKAQGNTYDYDTYDDLEKATTEAWTDPELFMLPITNAAPGDRYEIRMKYFQPMCFNARKGCCFLELPTCMPQACLPPSVDAKSVLEATVALNTVMSEGVHVNYPCIRKHGREPGMVSLHVNNSTDCHTEWPGTDLLVECAIWRDRITAVLQVELPPKKSSNALGTFVLSIMPPGPEESVSFPRDVVFVWDCSGSMRGDPMAAAKAALATGLANLDPKDRFGIVAFNHQQQWWLDHLVYASPENTQACRQWLEGCVCPHGSTDILHPLSQALRMLLSAPVQMGEIRLPVVFLLTDGCVANEREICKLATDMLRDPTACPDFSSGTTASNGQHISTIPPGVQTASLQLPSQRYIGSTIPAPPHHWQASTSSYQTTGSSTGGTTCYDSGSSIVADKGGGVRLLPRIFTFGIGPYCNHYFLKRLAAIGRGMSKFALRTRILQSSLEQMLEAAALPILSDLQLQVSGPHYVQLFPDPLPDVFVGQPLLVSGKYAGPWGKDALLTGLMPSGEHGRGAVPLDSIFAKSQLDHLVAEAWLQDNPPQLVQQICSLSLRRNIPVAPYTVAVEFSATPRQVQKLKVQPLAALQ